MLSEILDSFSAPRKALWSALGGPESGTELVSNLTGLDRDSLLTKGLGFAAETALDPMTYLLPAGVGALGKALRGVSSATKAAEAMEAGRRLGMTGEELYRYAPKAGRFLADEAGSLNLGALGREAADAGLAGGRSLQPLRQQFSVFKGVQPLDDFQTAQLENMIDAGEELAKGNVATVLRDAAGDVGYVGRTGNVAPEFVRDAGEASLKMPSQKFAEVMEDAVGQYGPQMRGTGGAYLPGQRSVFLREGVQNPSEALRHELMHGLTDIAARGGNLEGLGFVPRMAARLKSGPYTTAREAGLDAFNTPRFGLGTMMDELGAHMAEARGLGGQLRKGADFLFAGPSELLARTPLGPRVFGPERLEQLLGRAANRAGYAGDFAHYSPMVGNLYRALGYSPYAAGGALGAGGLITALNAFGDE